jgi:hypothetical protein
MPSAILTVQLLKGMWATAGWRSDRGLWGSVRKEVGDRKLGACVRQAVQPRLILIHSRSGSSAPDHGIQAACCGTRCLRGIQDHAHPLPQPPRTAAQAKAATKLFSP